MRNWVIKEVNDHILTFLNLPIEKARALLAQEITVLHFIFDPNLGLRQKLDCHPGDWKATAQRNIYGFKLTNLLTRQEADYIKVVNQLHSLPLETGFKDVWDKVRIDRMQISPFTDAEYITSIRLKGDLFARFNSLHIQHGDIAYPAILAYIPADSPSREVFASLGLPVPENNWGTH